MTRTRPKDVRSPDVDAPARTPGRPIVIAGGSGFLGRTLTRWLRARDRDVIVLTRPPHLQPVAGERIVRWDGRSTGPWVETLEGARALVNLAGRSVNCRYSTANRRQILDSRLESTRVLGAAVAAATTPPPVWLNASTATIYTHTFGSPHGEDGTIGPHPDARDAFSVEVAQRWEQAFDAAATPGTRHVALRTAMVFGREPGGVYETLARLTRWGLGGAMGDQDPYVSWIHEDDFCHAVDHLIRDPEATGVFNLAAPHPLRNHAMMAALRESLGVPFGLPATNAMLEIGAFLLRTETELVIKSRRVVPTRLLDAGFSFRFPRVPAALRELARPDHDLEGIAADPLP